MLDELIRKFEGNGATIGIIGLGYVGLPLAIRFAECGNDVVGLDVDASKIENLRRGKSYIQHIDADQLYALSISGAEFSTDFALAAKCDALIICVPTPLGKYRDPDLTYIVGTLEALKPYLRPGQLMVLESTTYPGTTTEVLQPNVEAVGLSVGEDFYLVYSPEREDPGNTSHNTRTIPKIVGGVSDKCKLVGCALYAGVIDTVVPVSSPAVAEMTKLLENIHRAVNIGLVNEMKVVSDRMGIDIFEVIDAAATKPFGFTPYYPGPGLGGHCIPIDPFYLTWKAREFGLHTRFIELAGEINQSMPAYVVTKLVDALNERGIPLKGAKVLVIGIAYKPNVDDMRESPAVELMEILSSKGAEIAYSDPHVPSFPAMRKHHFKLSSLAIDKDTVAAFDAVILATDHDALDYELIAKSARLIIDTRGRYRNSVEKIVKA